MNFPHFEGKSATSYSFVQSFVSTACVTPVFRRWIWVLLVVVVAVRLATLGSYPFFSTTEPRYAEIARKMLETGNWVTPWFDHGVPFWGKPPLSFWGSAATMGLLGVNEFAARLAPFLAAMATVAMFCAWPRRDRWGGALPAAAALITMSSLVGFVASGAVMTDMFMAWGTTVSMVGFWVAVNDPSGKTAWRWGFFVGLALGLLAKGPVATVITGLALFMWAVMAPKARLRLAWRSLPWIKGLALTALLTLPWYGLAELRTPGFLNYFIVGEHVQRFLVSGWTGDLYGAGHAEPRGLIWWFGFGGFLPWTPLVLLALWQMWRRGRGAEGLAASAETPTVWVPGEWQYLLAWTVAPLLFFTMARNILEAYVLPGLPGFALFAAIVLLSSWRRTLWSGGAWALALVWPILGSMVVLQFPEIPSDRSQKALLMAWKPESALYYLGVRPLSANFYSSGRAILVDDADEFAQTLAKRGDVTLVVEQPWLDELTPEQLRGWNIVGKHAGFTMLHR